MTVSPDVANRDTSRAAYGALIFFTVVVATVTFVLSFHGLDDYGVRVAGLGRLSPLVPLGVDGLTLVAVAATYLLRFAPWRVRSYAWLVFAIAVGASVAGNLSHASARHLGRDGWVGAAAWPILLALASHMVIVTRRWMERHRDVPTSDTQPDTEPVADQPEGGPDPRPFDPKAYARRQAGQGRAVAVIGRALRERYRVDVSDKTVGRWTEDIRTRTNGGTPPATTEPAPEAVSTDV